MESIGIERDGSGRIKIYCSPFSNVKLKLEVRSLRKGIQHFSNCLLIRMTWGGGKKKKKNDLVV